MYHGLIKDASLCQAIAGVTIKGYDKNKNEIFSFISDKEGRWEFEETSELYYVIFSKDDFSQKKILFSTDFPSLIRLLEKRLIGYQDKLFFVPGEQVIAKIHTSKSYHAKLFRYGKEMQLILDLGEFPERTQQVPNGYFVESGLNWDGSVEYQIPENAVPGLYGLILEHQDGSDYYSITFTVSTPKNLYGKKSKILVLASTNTWQTYNVWGGRSRYRNFEFEKKKSWKNTVYNIASQVLPERLKKLIRNKFQKQFVISIHDHPDDWQFQKLNVHRPHPNCHIPDTDVYEPFISHLSAGEWRILAWLERENIDYDFVAGIELHHDSDLLQHYSSIVLSTHCEYWSREMYDGLEQFHESGGSILNISGNSIYREVTFDDALNIQCLSLRFGKTVKDETQLIGVRFDMRGYQTCAPYKVLLSDHWVFLNTELQNGCLFSKESLNQPSLSNPETYDPTRPGMLSKGKLRDNGGSGWETDKLSETASEDILLLAQGKNPQNGGAQMIVREAKERRGLLFSASSITFGASLLVDKKSSQIVKNVLNRALT